VLARGSKNLSAPRIPHASSASRSYPLLQHPSGTRPASPLSRSRRSVTPVTAGRPWPPSLGLTDYHRLAAAPTSRPSVNHRP